MLRLYDYLPSGNGYKARLLLTQLAIPFELIKCDIIKGETRTPEFLAKYRAAQRARCARIDAIARRYIAEADNARVFVLHAGVLEPVPLKTGLSDGTWVQVLNGNLAAGQRVVIDEIHPESTPLSPPRFPH